MEPAPLPSACRISILTAEARKQADITRGQGDAQAVKIFADAYGRDPEFCQLVRSCGGVRHPWLVTAAGAPDVLGRKQGLTTCPISETLRTVKPAIFHRAAREAIRAFPTGVRRQLGKAILDLQKGHHLGMPLSRPIPEVAAGVEELRIRDAAGIYRTFFFTKSRRAILILHAFVKKTQKTPQDEITLARRRLKEMRDEEQEIGHRA